jgi:multiple sugar transport system substrate-binding protein
MLVLIFALVFFFVSERTTLFSPEFSPERKVVNLWAFSMPAKTMLQMKDQFETQHPDITLEVQTVPWESMQNKALWAIAADSNVPDVIVGSSEWLGGLVSNGALDPLDAYLDEEFFARYLPATLGIYRFPEIRRDRPRGRGPMRQYGVPLDLDLMLVFYRADVLEPIMQRVGMQEFPQTWNELERLARAVRETQGDRHLFYLDPDDLVPMSMALLPSSGASFLDPSLSRAVFNSPEATEAFSFFNRMLRDDLMIQWNRSTMEDPIVLYKSGALLANIAGPWYSKMLQAKAPEQAGRWRVALFPRREPGLPTSGLGGACLAMPYNARNKPEAIQLIKFMSDDRFALAYFERVGSPPPQMTAWENPVFESQIPYFGGQRMYRVVRQAIESAKPLQLMPNSEVTKGTVRWAMHQIFVRGAEENRTLDRAVMRANRLLRE